MEDKKNNRSRIVAVRFKPDEYLALYNKFRLTTCRQLSEYVRRVLFERKITMYTRNKSLDEFMAEMIQLRNEFSSIGNNLNQAVRKLNSLQQIPEIKVWLIFNDSSNKELHKKVEEIKSRINQFSEKWSQE
jgi:hypothetical protein